MKEMIITNAVIKNEIRIKWGQIIRPGHGLEVYESVPKKVDVHGKLSVERVGKDDYNIEFAADSKFAENWIYVGSGNSDVVKMFVGEYAPDKLEKVMEILETLDYEVKGVPFDDEYEDLG